MPLMQKKSVGVGEGGSSRGVQLTMERSSRSSSVTVVILEEDLFRSGMNDTSFGAWMPCFACTRNSVKDNLLPLRHLRWKEKNIAFAMQEGRSLIYYWIAMFVL
ncbi:hypothetical protein AVEN_128472-1 [Araneus ventricosus]|uniref:Uncharacterized protein n=1 Tax=Araneus ventricosus TaxID=182803 RepID=A0A4Y2RPP7_ARAVE|nr:hypothetical protein AVEN_128472-1 [Araneus ventricosus]